jgi:phosphoenolpyruvate carboxylase
MSVGVVNELLEEVKELKPEEIAKVTTTQPAEAVQTIGEELSKEDPNYLRVFLGIMSILLSLLGTFFGIYFGAIKK